MTPILSRRAFGALLSGLLYPQAPGIAFSQQAKTPALSGKALRRLEHDPNAPVLGNPDGDVTIVEFFDYSCGFCKRTMPELDALLARDGNIRLVMREWPILGDGSDFAARAALASRKQGKYAQIHKVLMGGRGRLTPETVLRLARRAGLDINRLQADMQAPEVGEHIETSMKLAEKLGFYGTPTFVVGGHVVFGFTDSENLSEMVAEARAAH